MTDEKRDQVAKQCDAVAHLAKVIADLHVTLAGIVRSGKSDALLNWTGQRTASLMENLGDVLNGMDSVTEDDAWMEPIFKEAQKRWGTIPPPPDPNDCSDQAQAQRRQESANG